MPSELGESMVNFSREWTCHFQQSSAPMTTSSKPHQPDVGRCATACNIGGLPILHRSESGKIYGQVLEILDMPFPATPAPRTTSFSPHQPRVGQHIIPSNIGDLPILGTSGSGKIYGSVLGILSISFQATPKPRDDYDSETTTPLRATHHAVQYR